MGEQLSFYNNQLFIKKEPTSNVERQKSALKELEFAFPLYDSCYQCAPVSPLFNPSISDL